jgi:3',5'-cyclic AMP phosphodiesterase CpdA
MNIVQLSDTHFGTEVPAVAAALRRSLRAQPIDLLILSGDITQRARADQFRAARAFIDALQPPTAPPLLAVPGNHDIPLLDLPRRLLSPYGRYAAFFGSDLQPVFENERVLVIGVDATRRYRHIDGQIDARQIDAVAQRLQRTAPDKIRVVVAHQPFDAVAASDEKNRVHGGGAALQRWADSGLDLVLGGHIHYPFARPLRQRYPQLAGDAWVVQAGTAISRRVRSGKPNSFNRLSIGADRAALKIERWDYDGATGEFFCAETHRPWHDGALTQ